MQFYSCFAFVIGYSGGMVNQGNFKNKHVNRHDDWKKFLYEKKTTNVFQRGLESLKQPFNLLPKIQESSLWLKSALAMCLLIWIAGFGLVVFGGYMVSTREVPTQGGDVTEVFIGNEIRHFNPVLKPNSEFEERVTQLIYHPLYMVSYKDMINDNSKPTITNVLLEKDPEWQSDATGQNQYRVLNMRLKRDLKWSDGKPITTEDIRYTFERLKEDTGNPKFQGALQNVSFKAVNGLEFQLVSDLPNPDLIYRAGFRPISKNFFGEQSNIGLLTDSKSIFTTVTSGFFSIPDAVSDPFPQTTSSDKEQFRPNPIRNARTGKYETLVLTRNANSNYQNPYINKYILTNLESLNHSGNANSLEKFEYKEKINLFNRFLPDYLGQQSSMDIKKILPEHTQISAPTNTVYSVFLNIRRRADGFFINSNLRKYVICHLNKFEVRETWKDYFWPIPSDKKLLPVQIGATQNDCSASDSDIDQILTSAKDDSGRQIYQIRTDENRGQKQVYLYGLELRLNLLSTLPANHPVVGELRKYLLDIGIPTEDPITREDAVSANLNTESKTFHIALMPVDMESQTPYSLLGQNGYNLMQVSRNDRGAIPSYNFEENLKAFAGSNYQDKDSQNKLTDFFGKEYVMMNLFQGRQEVNYFRLNPKPITTGQLYSPLTFMQNLPKWYFNTKREF